MAVLFIKRDVIRRIINNQVEIPIFKWEVYLEQVKSVARLQGNL